MKVSAFVTIYSTSEAIEKTLKDFGITYQFAGNRTIVFTIPDVNATAQHKTILSFLDSLPTRTIQIGNRIETLSAYSVRYGKEFSEDDRLAAQYLGFESSFICLSSINEETIMARRCLVGQVPRCKGSKHLVDLYRHFVQVEAPVTNQKRISWRENRCFGMAAPILHSLICNDRAKDIIISAGLHGAEFRPVLRKQDMSPLENAWQLWPTELDDFLVAGEGMYKFQCEKCGVAMLGAKDPNSIHEFLIDARKIPSDLDFFQSKPVFFGEQIPIISQRAYRVLKEANMLRAMIITPLRESIRLHNRGDSPGLLGNTVCK